jgi:hypothetical protein
MIYYYYEIADDLLLQNTLIIYYNQNSDKLTLQDNLIATYEIFDDNMPQDFIKDLISD